MATTRARSNTRNSRGTGTQRAVTSLPQTGLASLIASLREINPSRAIFVVCLLSLLAYANSLGGEFVFDDTEQIVENQDIRSWDNLAKAFTTSVWAFRDKPETLNVPPPLPYYRPLFTVMLTTEYRLFGLWPQGWHLVSLLLHVLCSVGVFYVILLMSGRKLVAMFASVLFAVHPVHAESVSWISGMTDPLFGVFFLGSLYFYLKARALDELAKRRALVLSLVIFALSTLAKETALSMVLLMFAYELIALSGSKKERLIEASKRALPYLGVALVYLVPRYLVLGESMWKNPQAADRPLAHTLLTLPFVICSYLAHLVWPIGLSVTYNTHFVTSVTSPSFLLPAAALGLLVSALFVYRKRISRNVGMALLLIFIPLLPVLNLGQVSREEYLVFDHYLYLSVAGLGYLVAMLIFKLGVFEFAAPRRPAFAIAVFSIIAVASTVAAARENRAWADSYSLWSKVARVRPNYWAGHYNTALALLDAKRFDEARGALERSAHLKPDEANVFEGLGRAYDGLGDVSRAVNSFKHAIEIDPELFEAYNDLGTVYFKNKDYALAEVSFTAALRLKPEAIASRFNLGLCYARQGLYSDAARELERVIQSASNDAEAFYELGLAYERMGRRDDAVRVFQRGHELAKSPELADKISESLTRLRGEIR